MKTIKDFFNLPTNQFVFLLIGLFISIFGISCHKYVDEIAPTLTLIYPNTVKNYQPGDTLFVKVKVEDNWQIKWVKASIDDKNGVSKTQQSKTDLSLTQADVSFMLIIPNQTYKTDLVLTITASDGINESKIFWPITVMPGSINSQQLILLVNFGNSLKVEARQNIGNSQTLATLDVDGEFLALQRNHKAIYVAGALEGKLYCLNDLGLTLWTKTFNNFQPEKAILGMCADSNRVYVACREGRIYGFDADGIQTLQINVPSDYLPGKLYTQNGLLVAVLSNLSQPTKIMAYNLLSGLTVYQTAYSNVVNGFAPLDAERFLVSATSPSGNGLISVFNANANFNNQLDFPVSAVPLKMQALGDGTNFFVQTSNGISRFTYNPIGFVNYISSGVSNDIAFDAQNHQLVLAVGNQLNYRNTLSNSDSYVFSSNTFKRIAFWK